MYRILTCKKLMGCFLFNLFFKSKWSLLCTGTMQGSKCDWAQVSNNYSYRCAQKVFFYWIPDIHVLGAVPKNSALSRWFLVSSCSRHEFKWSLLCIITNQDSSCDRAQLQFKRESPTTFHNAHSLKCISTGLLAFLFGQNVTKAKKRI